MGEQPLYDPYATLYATTEGIRLEGLFLMMAALAAILVPIMILHFAAKHFLSLKRFGTAHLDRHQVHQLQIHSPALRLISGARTAISLVLGAAFVEFGFLIALGGEIVGGWRWIP